MDKTYILSEIKRTAEANGGTPLGKVRFSQATGIQVSDWEGRHWSRWGDAIREAGLSPNAMQTAYERSMLMQKYVSLARELGRLPVEAELRMKARNDPSFPSHNTFRRLGAKAERIASVAAFCKELGNGYDDIVAMCEAALGAAPTSSTPSGPKQLNDDTAGFVYLLKSGRYYKIGRNNAAGRRERELAIQLPERADMVHSIRTDDPGGIEAYWHKRFATKRKNGEWFELTKDDVLAFKTGKFM